MAAVLVVDDEWAIAEVIADILGDQGHRVATASNGKQALARVREDVPDLIILDFMMPIVDGATTLRALAADPKTAVIPVVLMSSLPLATLKERCTGFTAYIQKPFLLDDIVGVVTRLLV